MVEIASLIGLVAIGAVNCSATRTYECTNCKTPTGGECPTDSPDSCEGEVCIDLGKNDQGATGLCSARCTTVDDCNDGENCIELTNDQSYCFQQCKVDTDCQDRFVCLEFGPDDGLHCVVDNDTSD